MAQLPQRFCLDLADTFAGDSEILTHFFKCMFGAVFQTEAHLDDALFAGRERIEHLLGHFLQIDVDNGIRR